MILTLGTATLLVPHRNPGDSRGEVAVDGRSSTPLRLPMVTTPGPVPGINVAEDGW